MLISFAKQQEIQIESEIYQANIYPESAVVKRDGQTELLSAGS